jgi:hypothetical protein
MASEARTKWGRGFLGQILGTRNANVVVRNVAHAGVAMLMHRSASQNVGTRCKWSNLSDRYDLRQHRADRCSEYVQIELV